MLYSLLRFWLSLNHSTITLERTIRRNALGCAPRLCRLPAGKCSSCKGSEHECYSGKRANYSIRTITVNTLNKQYWATTVCNCLMICEEDTRASLTDERRNLLFLKTKQSNSKEQEKEHFFIFSGMAYRMKEYSKKIIVECCV